MFLIDVDKFFYFKITIYVIFDVATFLNMKKIIFLLIFFVQTFIVNSQEVSTIAGSSIGFMEGNALNSKFNFPTGVCKDNFGNIYVADNDNHRIRKILPSGDVSTFAGSGLPGNIDGIATQARFNSPFGICVDVTGNVYVADKGNNIIRKISTDGVVSTLAGSSMGYANGIGNSARFNSPFGVCVDITGNVYVADYGNHKVRKISPAGLVTTLAGSNQGFEDGVSTNAKFNYLRGICIDNYGTVYVADYSNHKIRKISNNGFVTTIAGSTIGYVNGVGALAQFNYPSGISIDTSGNLFVVEEYNHTVRKIKGSGDVTTFAGTLPGFLDGPVAIAKFFQPCGIFVDALNDVYISDQSNQKIRKISNTLSNNINSTENFTITLSPNPTSKNIIINLPVNTELKKVIIYSALGQLIKLEKSNNIDVSYLSSGTYFIEVVTDKGKATKSFIKE